MSYALKIKPNAQKELARLSKSVANAAIKKIRALADDPYPTGCKKLVGSDHITESGLATTASFTPC